LIHSFFEIPKIWVFLKWAKPQRAKFHGQTSHQSSGTITHGKNPTGFGEEIQPKKD